MLPRRHTLLLLAVLSALLLPSPGQAAPTPPAQLRILGVNSAGHPNVDVIVHVRDVNGFGVRGLGSGDFAVEEDGRIVAGEALRVVTSGDAPPAFSAALVLDASTLLGARTLERLRADAEALVTSLLGRANEQIELGLFVPRGGDQRPVVVPFTGDRETMLQALRSAPVRNGRTDIYNTVAAAIGASADQAGRRGVPGFVIVLSDGLDRTSIVGGGAGGANEVAQLGESRRVQLAALGYGGGRDRGAGALAQVADRTGGVYIPNPGAADLASLADTLRQRASGGAYRLSYRTSLPPDGAEHPVTVRVGPSALNLSARTEMLLPKPWDSDATTGLVMQLDGHAYPNLSIAARPINRMRRTVTTLSGRDFLVTIDGERVDTPVSIDLVPLDPLDPAATQTVALVVDQGGPDAAALRDLAAPLLQAPAEVPSRVGLFVPGVALGPVRFTHDHNAVLNTLNATASRAAAGVPSGPTLLNAISAAAADADAAQRPAYLIWFVDSTVPLDQRLQALAQARNQRVTLHIVTVGPADIWLEPLARIGGGRLLVSPDARGLRDLADQIAADRAVHYRLGFRAPDLADGRQRTIAVQVGSQQASAPLVAFVPGTSAARMPLAPAAQIGLFGLLFLGLMLAAWLPRGLQDRRLRCRTCQRVRRAEWGSDCLFCAQQPQAGVAAGVPLDGFARQGAALIQEHHTPLSDRTPTPPEQTADHVRVPPAPPLNMPPVPSLAHTSDQARDMPGLTSLEVARAQTHTDFWGPLPGETLPPLRHAPVSMPFAAEPPPLPVFEPVERFQPASEPPAEPDRGVEQGHTDFWGSPAEPDAGEASEQPEASTGLGAPPSGHTDFWGSPAEPDAGEVAEQPEASTGLGAPPSGHTDFWGSPAEPDEPRRAANARAEQTT